MPTGTWFNIPQSTIIVTTPTTPTCYVSDLFTSYRLLDSLYSAYRRDFTHLSTLLLSFEELQSQFPEYLL